MLKHSQPRAQDEVFYSDGRPVRKLCMCAFGCVCRLRAVALLVPVIPASYVSRPFRQHSSRRTSPTLPHLFACVTNCSISSL
jgi:hypothetical protein